MPFLNQRKGENDRRTYFMINLHQRMLPISAGVEPETSKSPVRRRIQMRPAPLHAVKWICSNPLLVVKQICSNRLQIVKWICSNTLQVVKWTCSNPLQVVTRKTPNSIMDRFLKRLTKMLTWDDARPPGHRYFKRLSFLKTRPKRTCSNPLHVVK